MSGLAVVVDFRLKPGMRSRFRALIDANADASVTMEADCLQFDVLEPEGEPDRILLYEIYSHSEAFQTHLDSRHYAEFAAASADLCDSKSVVTCALVHEGGSR